MEHETAGDPVSGCKWTRKTTEKIAQQFKRAGIFVCANTVGKLLKKMHYHLRVNIKTLESGLKKPPDPRQRDLQFRYIRSQIRFSIKMGVIGFESDDKVWSEIDTNLGSEYKWISGPTRGGGEFQFGSQSFTLTRNESTKVPPGSWTP